MTSVFWIHPSTDNSHFWDLALFYTADWNSIKISLAGAYTWLESNPLNGARENYWQVGGSVMHKPSGLGIYATGNWERMSADKNKCLVNPGSTQNNSCLDAASFSQMPDTNMWGIKPFWRKAWSPIGATVLFAEYAEYNDFYGLANINLGAGVFNLPACNGFLCTITDSSAQRWGLGVVQEIDSAAMHVWLRWQHQELDATVFREDGAHVAPELRRLGSDPGWWHHILLSHTTRTSPTEAALRGGFFFWEGEAKPAGLKAREALGGASNGPNCVPE